jgi:Uncharacterized protein conserved in bacteria (DUF2252)
MPRQPGPWQPMTEAATGPGPMEAGTQLRTPRAAAVAGIIFSVLAITAMTLLRLSAPDRPSAAGMWLTDSGHRAAVAIGLNLVPFAGIAFLWVIGVLRDRIGEREDRFFATVFLGSGLLFVGMLFVGAAHARSGDPVAIAEYLGSSDAFDQSIIDFSERYADQNEKDYEEFTGAIRAGRLQAVQGV